MTLYFFNKKQHAFYVYNHIFLLPKFKFVISWKEITDIDYYSVIKCRLSFGCG